MDLLELGRGRRREGRRILLHPGRGYQGSLGVRSPRLAAGTVLLSLVGQGLWEGLRSVLPWGALFLGWLLGGATGSYARLGVRAGAQ